MKTLSKIIGIAALLAMVCFSAKAQVPTYGAGSSGFQQAFIILPGVSNFPAASIPVIDCRKQQTVALDWTYVGPGGISNSVAVLAPSTTGLAGSFDTNKTIGVVIFTGQNGTHSITNITTGGYGYLGIMYISNSFASLNETNTLSVPVKISSP